METIAAIHTRRTIRKFTRQQVPQEVLASLVDAARMSAQGSNLQPLKYCVVSEPDLVKAIFARVRWAAYIAPNGNPAPGEEPTAYILMLCDQSIKKDCDVDAGSAGATLLLAAHAQGLGACWMGAIDRPAIADLIGIKEPLVLHTLFALGYPAESPVCVESTGSIRYYKDETGRLHVPKRRLNEIMYVNRVEGP